MMHSNGAARRLLAIVLGCAVALTAVLASAVPGPAPARADTAPLDPKDPATPVTVSADALPTVQVNGVVWQQLIVGNTVYVAGKFSTARPAGAAAGTKTVKRYNILAYNLTTGKLITKFAPKLNAQAVSLAASPDGKRIYVGGSFTKVNGTKVWRIAALNAKTGKPITSFRPKVASQVRAIVATKSAVYLGGTFTSVGSATRLRLAAVKPSNGALLAWKPKATGKVHALALSASGKQMVVGGAFTKMNGKKKLGYGLARVDTKTGKSLSLAANATIRDAGEDSAILSLFSDGTYVYGTGYRYRGHGNLEGAFAISWKTGKIHWLEDCHGDTYGIWASSKAVYTAGHAHNCLGLGAFPETDPRSYHRALAFSRAATGKLAPNEIPHIDFGGMPAPSLLTWFPDLNAGKVTGQNQGPWTVTGTSKYVVMGGEFTTVNGTKQQGLVRFAVRSIAPNLQGPRLSGARFMPELTDLGSGSVQVRWQANWDRDNSQLTYSVIRDGKTSEPVGAVTAQSTFWDRPELEFTDTGLEPGTHEYRIFATDPLGNEVRGDTATVTVAGPDGAADPLAAADSFARTAVEGWGRAETGGAWQTDGTASSYSVAAGVGTIRPGTGQTLTAWLDEVSSTSTDTRVLVVPGGTSGAEALVAGRHTDAGQYRARLAADPAGGYRLRLERTDGTAVHVLAEAVVPGSVPAGSGVQIRLQVAGTGTTALRAKAWPAGSAEPGDWQVDATDTTADLQRAGTAGLGAAAGTGTAGVDFDDFSVGSAG